MVPKMMMTMIMMMGIMMMMMKMKMKIKIIKTQLIFELGTPNFVWQQIQIIPKDDDNNYVDDDVDYDDNDDESDNDDELDDEDQNCNNSANFQARSSRLCMVIYLENTQGIITMMRMMMKRSYK